MSYNKNSGRGGRGGGQGGGRWRKRSLPTPPKKTVVRWRDSNVLALEVNRVLSDDNIGFTVFPSRKKAQAAIWRTTQASHVPDYHRNFVKETYRGEAHHFTHGEAFDQDEG